MDRKTLMKKQLDGWMDRKNRRMVGWTGKMEGWLDGYKNVWIDRKMVG